MAQHNRESWQVKDVAILSELMALLDLSADDRSLLAGLHKQSQSVSGALTKAFYDRLFAHNNTAEYLKDASMDRLHTMVAEWFHDLFSGVYDEAYARKRLEIGRIHVRIGLPVRYPLAMLDVVAQYGESIARQSPQPEQAVVAFRKVLALDVAIFNQAYEDNQLKHLAELVGGDRLARLLLAG